MTADPSLTDRLVECFSDVFPAYGREDILRLDNARSEDWDSLASISLLAVIEEEFDIHLDEAAVETMTTFGSVHAAVAAAVETG